MRMRFRVLAIVCCVTSMMATLASCAAANSPGEFGDVSAESAKTLAPADPASLFTFAKLSVALDRAAIILPGSTVETIKVEPGKMFVSANTSNGEFAVIVVAANGKVHAVVSKSPTRPAVAWSDIDKHAGESIINAAVQSGEVLASVKYLIASVDDSEHLAWSVYVDSPRGHLEGDAHGKITR